MKTRITQLVAALFFVLVLAGNVNATKHDVKASSHESIETTLELESWMIDENVWNTSTFSYIEATETTLKMENWMTDEIVWEVEYQGLALENWMTDKNVWEVKNTFKVEKATEQELAMETWMINEDIWDI